MKNFNLSTIMTTAWTYFNANANRVSFASALRRAWVIAKYMAAKAKAIQAKVEAIDSQIFSLAMKDMWNQDDYTRDRKLNAQKYTCWMKFKRHNKAHI